MQQNLSVFDNFLIGKILNIKTLSSCLRNKEKLNYLVYLGNIADLEVSSLLINFIFLRTLFRNNTINKAEILVNDLNGYYLHHKPPGNTSETKINSLLHYCMHSVGLKLSDTNIISSSSLYKRSPNMWIHVTSLLSKTTIDDLKSWGKKLYINPSASYSFGRALSTLAQVGYISFLKPDIVQINQRLHETIDNEEIKRPSFVLLKDIACLGNSMPGAKEESSMFSGKISLYSSREEINEKVNKAYCPQGQVINNPILDWFKLIVYAIDGQILIKRPKKWGGDILIGSFTELSNLYTSQKVHPADLKNFLGNYINKLVGMNRA